MVRGVPGSQALSAEVIRQIVARTDGVPLFVKELTKAVLEANELVADAARPSLTAPHALRAIPVTLQDALRARLDRLAEGKAVAQLGAVLGRTFAYTLLQAVAPLDEGALGRGVTQLVQAEILSQRGVLPQATYTFKHALIQEVAYQSLLRRTRQQVHQRTAQVLAVQFPHLAETQPELLAQHYTAAGLAEEAVGYWQRAGAYSFGRSAYVEAVAHCTTGLEVLQTLPETSQRAQQELNLLLTRLEGLRIVKGYAAPEVGQGFARARELCHQVGDSPQIFNVLIGLGASYYQNRGELQAARELLEQAFTLAQELSHPFSLVRALHYATSLHIMRREWATAQARVRRPWHCPPSRAWGNLSVSSHLNEVRR
jgi:tetratricopeptide (TPR) repeat protein